MKKIIASVLWYSALGHAAFAGTGSFFNVTVNGPEVEITTTKVGHYYPNAGIKLGDGYSISSSHGFSPGTTYCTTVSNGFCLFPVSDQDRARFTVEGPKGPLDLVLALNGAGPVTSQNVTKSLPKERFVYLTSDDLNPGGTKAYSCWVNLSTGSLSHCTATTNTFTSARELAVDPAGTNAYVVNNTSPAAIYKCPIDAGTGELAACTQLATPAGLNNPSGITFNNAGTYAYVTDYGPGTITKCSFNKTSATFFACAPTSGSGSFPSVTDIALNPDGTRAYVTENGGGLKICSVAAVSGELVNCTQSNSGFSNTEAITFNPTGTRAYLAQQDNHIQSCAIQPSTGDLINCSSVVSDYNGHGNLLLNSAGTIAYYPSNSAPRFKQCLVNTTTGALTSCTNAGNGTLPATVFGSAFR